MFGQGRKFAILDFSYFLQVIISLRNLNLIICGFDFLTEFPEFVNGGLFIFQLCLLGIKFITKFCQFLLQGGESFLT